MEDNEKAKYKNSYDNGTREYERLCNEKMSEFKTYISISVAVLALQCSDLLQLSGWKCFLLPIVVLVISIIFILMTHRTETFIKNTRERLVNYEVHEQVDNEWYMYEKKKLRADGKRQIISLHSMIVATYIIMTVLSFLIAILRTA